MKWSLHIGKFLGIDVFLHFTFILFIGIVGWIYREHGPGTVIFLLSAFFCVVLHEYGHALVARRFGIPTRDITLLPIGGVARLERMPTNPQQELLIAVAGPAVNIVIAVVLSLVLLALRQPVFVRFENLLGHPSGLLRTLFTWNLTMVAFNMLPAFPMDGGRVLRAALAMKLPYDRATNIAASIGKAIAILFAFYAIFHNGNPMLILIAFFVWMGATDEAHASTQHVLLTGQRVRDAMLVEYRTLAPDDTVGTAAQWVLQGWQTDFPVTFESRMIGILTRQGIIEGLRHGHVSMISSYMLKDVPTCTPDEPLEDALARMRERDLPLLPVLEEGNFRGLITPENTLEFLAFRKALRERLA